MTQDNTTPVPPSPGSGRRWAVWAAAAAAAAVALVAGLAIGAWVGGGEPNGPAGTGQTAPSPAAPSPQATVWTCPMHPQIRQPEFGQCPICGMDLVPLSEVEAANAGTEGGSPRRIELSEEARALARIETAPVERRFPEATVRMVGKLDYDQTRLAYVTAWLPGRLERLYVDYVGMQVRKGDHMVDLYSPELIQAQAELHQAIRAAKEIESSRLGIMRETTEQTVQAVRDKLRLWGLKRDQIDRIAKTDETLDRLTIYAPIGGTVIEKHVLEGAYVQPGTRIYTLADLSSVWAMLDAYESDLAWLRYGQDVTFTTEAYPGTTFHGRIALIDPAIDPRTRTAKVRVNVANPGRTLKPDMFVRAEVRTPIAAAGPVMDPALAGKWICPMHPGVIEDHPGDCPICGMPLEKTETLGYVAATEKAAEAPVVIPASAPLITGKRAVVYVAVPGEAPAYEGRDVVLGPRAGNYYIVREGLAEGERVVTHGAFMLDSELQIRAKPSMMYRPPEPSAATPATEAGAPAEQTLADVPDEFRADLARVWEAYRKVSEALASDDAPTAKDAAAKAQEALAAVPMERLSGDAHEQWMGLQRAMKASLGTIAGGGDIEPMRAAFEKLSGAMASAITVFGLPAEAGPVYRVHCPMAFENRGADWLQATTEVHNPYFGATMPRCGEVVATLAAPAEAAEEPAR